MNLIIPETWQTIIVLVVIGNIFLCLYCLYAQYGKQQTNIRLTMLLIGAATLVFLGISGIIFSKYLTLFIRLMLTASLVYGVLSSYYYLVFLLSDATPYKPKDLLFPSVSILLVFILFLDYQRGDNSGSFVMSDPFVPNTVNLLYYTCLFLMLPCIKVRVVLFLLRSLKRQRRDGALTLRCILWLSGFSLAIVADLSVVVKLMAYISLNYAYQQAFGVFFLAATTVVTILLLIAMLPQRIFVFFSNPIDRALTRRRQQEDAIIASLHGLLVQIVTVIQLPDGYTSTTRMLVEIGHARRIIGTTIPRTESISLVDEARHIAQVVQAGEPLTEGAYPPFPKPQNARKHYIALAHELEALGVSVWARSSPGIYAYHDAGKPT